ncbi:MAG: hypothetical protein M3P29_08465, partial [Acidobacteriota bacterium]|nr:hypothetical protein [Acidobacteriota bacterium]
MTPLFGAAFCLGFILSAAKDLATIRIAFASHQILRRCAPQDKLKKCSSIRQPFASRPATAGKVAS